MTCATFLYDSELNQRLPDEECQAVLEEAREHTGKNWQVVPVHVHRRRWFKRYTETLYGVYVYVGGVGPWQQINFYSGGSQTSINLYVSLDVVAAYFLGMLAVPRREEKTIRQKLLTDDEIWKNEEIMAANSGYGATFETLREVIRATERAHGIEEK